MLAAPVHQKLHVAQEVYQLCVPHQILLEHTMEAPVVQAAETRVL